MDKPARPIVHDVVTPTTTVLVVVCTATGVMLLQWQGGLARVSHDWLSLAVGAFAAWHLVMTWRASLPYLWRHAAISTLVVSLAVTAATLETAAPALGLAPAAAAQAVQEAGFAAASPADTLEANGARNAPPSMAVLDPLAAARP